MINRLRILIYKVYYFYQIDSPKFKYNYKNNFYKLKPENFNLLFPSSFSQQQFHHHQYFPNQHNELYDY